MNMLKKSILLFALFFGLSSVAWSQGSAEGAKFLAAIPSSGLGSPFGASTRSIPKVFAPQVKGYVDQEEIEGDAFTYQMLESKTQMAAPSEEGLPASLRAGFTSGAVHPTGCGPNSKSVKCLAVFARCVISSFYVHQYQVANPAEIEGALPEEKLQDKLCPESAEYYLKKAAAFSHGFFGL